MSTDVPSGRDEVSAAVLAAAAELFAERGPSATSIRDVAARAKVNHGLVHRHFGSKEKLVGAVLDHLAAELNTLLDAGAPEADIDRALDRQARVRLRQGDISQLDARLAEAELQRSEAAARLAQAERARSTAQLQRLYPGLPEPRWPQGEALPPPLPTQPLDAALQEFLAHHHELNLLRAEARRQQQLAERVERDRWPDPSVGLYTARERAGGEQLVGLSLAMPLSGTYRESQARAAQAEAQALAQRVQQLERELGAQFEARWLQLAQQQQALVALRAAAATQRLAADKSLTAYTLGEHSMTELIQNRRLANEQHLASQRLLLDGLQSRALIELDAHRLWDLDD